MPPPAIHRPFRVAGAARHLHTTHAVAMPLHTSTDTALIQDCRSCGKATPTIGGRCGQCGGEVRPRRLLYFWDVVDIAVLASVVLLVANC
jgi:hypothetical protein